MKKEKKRIGPLSTTDWEAIDMLVKFFVIFYNSILVLSTSTFVTSYKCYNKIVTISRNLIFFSNSSEEELHNIAKVMIEKLDMYWDVLGEMNKLLIITSIFDPRNKMNFAQLCFEKLHGKDNVEPSILPEFLIYKEVT